MSVKCPSFTNLVLRKVEKENHIRKVRKSEERKVKKIGKVLLSSLTLIFHISKVTKDDSFALYVVHFTLAIK